MKDRKRVHEKKISYINACEKAKGKMQPNRRNLDKKEDKQQKTDGL